MEENTLDLSTNRYASFYCFCGHYTRNGAPAQWGWCNSALFEGYKLTSVIFGL